MKTVLLLGDITGRSRVALRMLSAVLERRGRDVLMAPTALISNTLNLGAHAMLDTTDYMLESLAVWEKLGLEIDLAYIGYVTGMEQARILCGVADRLRARGVRVVLDPILGDNGKKYNSVSEGQAQGMRLLLDHADLATPNWTEACLLAQSGQAEAEQLAAELAACGTDILITSAKTADGRDAVVGCADGERFEIPFERVPGHHWGTGDLFTALLLDALLEGETPENAAAKAAGHVTRQLRGEEACLLPAQ